MLKKISMRMMAVPRSGCRRMRRTGMTVRSDGMMRSFSVRPSPRGSSCRNLARAMASASFMNSLGWNWKLPTTIQRAEPRMSRPKMKTRMRQTTPPM
jgi:hypothetical protein